MSAPLILALAVHPDDEEGLDALRRRHFPSDRNQIRAHVTLFHALPGDHLPDVLGALTRACRREPFTVTVDGVRSLGRGAALTLASPDLLGVRAELAGEFAPWLTRQDAQKFSPHVTVQNFVTPDAARSLVGALSADFRPWPLRARGIAVHRYLGGPWELVDEVAFTSG